MQVKELMGRRVVAADPSDTAQNAALLLARHNVGALPVCDENGGLRGVITDRDIVTRCVALRADPAKTPVGKVMTRACATVSPTADTREAARIMAARQVRRLAVVENDKVIGMISLGDLSQSRSCDMEAAAALAEISEEPHTIAP